MFQTKVVEKIKTQILCSVNFFRPKNRAVYEIMWKNIVEQDRPQMKIKHDACAFTSWITKATDTHSEYVILIAFFSPSATMVMRTRLIVKFKRISSVLCDMSPFGPKPAFFAVHKTCQQPAQLSIPIHSTAI